MIRVLALLSLVCSAASAQTAQLNRIGGYGSGLASGSVEIVAYDAQTRRAFTVNGTNQSFDIVDLANPSAPALIQRVSTAAIGSPNSVAVAGGIVAVAIQNATAQNPGAVAFYSTTGALLGQVAVGALPDMVTFSPNGRYAIAANEGEPNAAYTVDPEGSVSIIDLAAGVAGAVVTTARFVDFNVGGPRNGEVPANLRIFGPGASVAQDLEPEYVAISPDSRTAYVSLQENNGLAVIDIATARVTRLIALGFKNHGATGNAFDPSDRDSPTATGSISIRSFPVFGMYQPDSIAIALSGGEPIVFTANEGDARDYAGFAEEVRVGAASYALDPVVFPTAATLKQNANLGRLNVTNRLGNTDADPEFEAIYSFGARSFSAFNGNTGALVFDSGDQFEQVTATAAPTIFNSEGAAATFDGRSDNKGPEPEALAIGNVGGRNYAFIGLERIGGAFVYDVTNSAGPTNLGYSPAQGGDVAPEGIAFVPPTQSGNNRALALIAHEVSGTLGVYEVATCTVSNIAVSVPGTVTITGYCPTGLDLYCGTSTSQRIATGVVVNTQATVNTPLNPGSGCFAALPASTTPINGIFGTIPSLSVSIPAMSPLFATLLALVLLVVGAVAVRRW